MGKVIEVMTKISMLDVTVLSKKIRSVTVVVVLVLVIIKGKIVCLGLYL